MDGRTARAHLQAAERARSAAESPPLPRWASPVAGAGVALGFLALAGLPFTVGGRLTALAAALVLWALAGGLVLRSREAAGVRGVRGRSRTTAVVLAVCALSLVPGAVGASPAMRWPYLVLALVGGVAMWWATRQRGRA